MKHMLIYTPQAGPVEVGYDPIDEHIPLRFNWRIESASDSSKIRAVEWMADSGFIDKLKGTLDPEITPYEQGIIEDLIAAL